jgi:hypothetical protein
MVVEEGTVNPEESQENNKAWAVRMLVLQMIHDDVMCLLHLFFERCLNYPQFSTHVNTYLTPLIDEPPVPKDQPGAFRIDRASLVDHEDVVGDGFDSRYGIHGGGWSLRVIVMGLSQV